MFLPQLFSPLCVKPNRKIAEIGVLKPESFLGSKCGRVEYGFDEIKVGSRWLDLIRVSFC